MYLSQGIFWTLSHSAQRMRLFRGKEHDYTFLIFPASPWITRTRVPRFVPHIQVMPKRETSTFLGTLSLSCGFYYLLFRKHHLVLVAPQSSLVFRHFPIWKKNLPFAYEQNKNWLHYILTGTQVLPELTMPHHASSWNWKSDKNPKTRPTRECEMCILPSVFPLCHTDFLSNLEQPIYD